jgi:adenylate cyclase
MNAHGRALVVDDSTVNRRLLVRRLESLGLEVQEAENGREALDRLADPNSQIDVVLLDVVMPELDGYQTLETMKSDERLRHIPVLIVSGVEEQDSVVRCIELGATDYLTKPIDPSILAARINASLAAKRLHDLEQESYERQAALNRTIQRQKEELSRFLSPQIAALVSSAEGEQLLAGHRREITVAFCDLRGFTSFAEKADPEELMALLNEYHQMMGEAITAHDGTLEHFAGDGVMVFFNDPIPVPDAAGAAVAMSQAVREDVRRLASGWARRGHDLALGIGVAQGFATLGRIGYPGRSDYAAIGSVTNLAARLCADAGPWQILVTDRVLAQVEEQVAANVVGDVQPRGFSRAVRVHDVLTETTGG